MYDCTKHVKWVAHKLKENVSAQSTKIMSFMTESREYDVVKADVMFTNFIIEHNLRRFRLQTGYKKMLSCQQR